LLNVLDAPSFDGFDERLLTRDQRRDAFARFVGTRSGREKPGRYWRVDLEAVALDGRSIDANAATVQIVSTSARVVAVDLATALRDHPALVARVFGATIGPRHKFAYLARAFAGVGAFIHVPADCAIDEPIVVTYRAGDGATVFPTTLLLLERGARATVVERYAFGRDAFLCALTEMVTGESSDLTYATVQTLPTDARAFMTRVCKPARDARVTLLNAELGSALALCDIETLLTQSGIEATTGTLFFPSGTQHVDIRNVVDHIAGHSTSETIVKSAASDSGQGRYLGSIQIAAHAQGSNAALRDDALLLSTRAHIDSIPALEIAANDVKAFHGATIGALDEDQLFYMTTRGIDRNAAERMIALGFFEPVIDRFPTETLREELRAALAAKVE